MSSVRLKVIDFVPATLKSTEPSSYWCGRPFSCGSSGTCPEEIAGMGSAPSWLQESLSWFSWRTWTSSASAPLYKLAQGLPSKEAEMIMKSSKPVKSRWLLWISTWPAHSWLRGSGNIQEEVEHRWSNDRSSCSRDRPSNSEFLDSAPISSA